MYVSVFKANKICDRKVSNCLVFVSPLFPAPHYQPGPGARHIGIGFNSDKLTLVYTVNAKS